MDKAQGNKPVVVDEKPTLSLPSIGIYIAIAIVTAVAVSFAVSVAVSVSVAVGTVAVVCLDSLIAEHVEVPGAPGLSRSIHSLTHVRLHPPKPAGP